jgi:hypothetical protein
MDNKTTDYQITKTVRFKLIPEFADDSAKQKFVSFGDNLDRDTSTMSKDEVQDLQNSLEEKENLDTLITKLTAIKNNVDKLIFCSKTYGEIHHTIFNNFKISRGWLERYLKISFYDFLGSKDKTKSSYKLSELPFLVPAFKEEISDTQQQNENIPTEIKIGWFYRIEKILSDLDKVKIIKTDDKKDNRHRKKPYPVIALILNDLNKRNNLEFIKEFIEKLQIITLAIDDKSREKKTNYESLIKQIKTDIIELEAILKEKIKFFLPYKSEGVLICSSSFNYYTVNKGRKDLESVELEVKNKLNAKYELNEDFITKYNLSLNDAIAVLAKQFNKDKDVIKSEKNLDWPLSLENTFLYLCYWKKQQKVNLQEIVDKIIREKNKKYPNSQKINDLTAKIRLNPLYKFKNGLLIIDYVDLCSKITKLATYVNNEQEPDKKKQLSDKLEELQLQKKAYWTFDPVDSGKDKFKKNIYDDFINKFNEIADEYNISNTQLKAIEKDKIVSQQVGYWSVILEKDDKKYLYLIPRDGSNTLKDAHEFITAKHDKDDSNIYLYYFESLTFRALQKLCYKSYDNTFREDFKTIIPEKELDNDIINNAAEDDKDKVRIDIYKKVLRKLIDDKSKSIFLDYAGFDEIFDTEYRKIEDFDAALNKICYAKKVLISKDIENRLKNDFQAIGFEITSQDINFKHKYKKDISNPRYGTRIWDLFWKEENSENNFSTRLNPEIKILYREPKPSRVVKYGEDSDLYNSKFKNRYLHEQFTVAFTITENSNNPHFDYAFGEVDKNKKVQCIKDKIEKFNEKISNVKFALGIDVGNDSLAFVAACDTNLKPIKFNVLKINNLQYSKSNADLSATLGKECKNFFIKDNPSYFLNINQYHKTFTGLSQSINVAQQQMNEDFEKNFTKNIVTAIDLTNAKVVNGQIIINGDVSTHLKLKLLKAERQLAKLFQKDFKPENIELFIEDVDGKKYIKTKNLCQTKYLISRKDNDKITDFNTLYAYFTKGEKASTNYLKNVSIDNFIFAFDESQNIILKKVITKEEYDCLKNQDQKEKIYLENRIFKTKSRIIHCAKDTIISTDGTSTIIEIPKNPKNPAIKDSFSFDASLYDDFMKFKMAALKYFKNVRLDKSPLAKSIEKIEKEFPNGNLEEIDNNYYISKILFEKNNPKYNEILEEFYEKNYAIESVKKTIEKIKKTNANFTESATNDCLLFMYNEISILYIEESDKKYEKVTTIEKIKDTLIDFKDHQKLELASVVEKINNYRKALVANMVGVLLNIYQQCKGGNDYEGLIAFEGLSKSDIDKDFAVFEGNITVPLRIALLKKLQEFGLVPPFAEVNKLSNSSKFVIEPNEDDKKNTDILSKGDFKRYGIISFVNADKTSQCCPLCGKVVNKKDKNYPYENKAGIGHADNFMCYPKNPDDKCGFCTEKDKFTSIDISKIDSALQGLSETELIELFSSLDCNDKIASYNIAKRAIWNI